MTCPNFDFRTLRICYSNQANAGETQGRSSQISLRHNNVAKSLFFLNNLCESLKKSVKLLTDASVLESTEKLMH